MKLVYSLVILSCALFEARGYPYYPSYGNMDSLSYGSSDNSRGGMVMSRYYNPYYNPRAVGGGMAAFMVRQPAEQAHQPTGQYYMPDRRRQTLADTNFNVPPQQNEVFYPQNPENPAFESQPIQPVAAPTEATDIAEPTEKTEVVATTLKTVSVPEIVEPEAEEADEPAPKAKAFNKRKQVKRPVDEDEEEDYPPRMPTGAFFPMFFGYGRTAGGPGGPTAIANAFSTGRGGVATSHATAYGEPRPAEKL